MKKYIKSKAGVVTLSVLAILGVIVFLILGYVGCGSNPLVGGGTGGVRQYLGTQSPGDSWSWTIWATTETPTFLATNEAAAKWYMGNFTYLSSGFIKYEIEDSYNDEANGDTGYAVEQPYTMLIVKDDFGNTIVGTAKGSTPPTADQYVWIRVPDSGWSSDSDAYGTMDLSVVSDVFTIEGNSYKINDTLQSGPWSIGPWTFSDGRLTAGFTSWEIYFGQNKVVALDRGPGDGGSFGAEKQDQINSTLEAITKEFRGVAVKYNPSTGTKEASLVGFVPVPGFPSTIKSTVLSYGDVEVSPPTVTDVSTWEFGDVIHGNIYSGTLLSSTGYPADFKMILAKSGSKYLLMGIGLAEDGRPYSVFAIEK